MLVWTTCIWLWWHPQLFHIWKFDGKSMWLGHEKKLVEVQNYREYINEGGIVEVQTNHFRWIYRIHLKLTKKTERCQHVELGNTGILTDFAQKIAIPTPRVILCVLHWTIQLLYVQGYLNHTRSVKVHIDLKQYSMVLLTAFFVHQRSLRFDRGDKLSCCIFYAVSSVFGSLQKIPNQLWHENGSHVQYQTHLSCG